MRTASRLRRWTPALLVPLVMAVAGCSASSPSASPTPSASASTPSAPASALDTYGGYPSFLPSDTVDGGFAHQVVDASARRPALATQGDTVRVHVGDASVLTTVTGPAVPVAGQQYQAPTSPATWSIVLRNATGDVPIDPATFQAIDEDGRVYDLKPQGDVPDEIGPSQVARFKLFSPGISTGEGRLRWIPTGHLAPVEWDFVVETD